MADIQRHATVNWQGNPKNGRGQISGESGEFTDMDFSFPSRFQNEAGTNPEELVGAAHAACFNMVIAKELAAQGSSPENLETEATVTLREDGGNYEVTRIHLDTKGTVPDIDESTFRQIAQTARDNCPISQLLKPGLQELTVEVTLA